MVSKTPIDPQRVRHITGSFSWIDHRLLHDGFLASMTSDEMLLYFFLVLVGDRHGLSFYSYDKICSLLQLEVERLLVARDRLAAKALIAFADGRYQVLQLPERPKPSPFTPSSRELARSGEFRALAELFQQLQKPTP